MKAKLFVVILISLFCFGCASHATYTNGKDDKGYTVHTITASRHATVTFTNGKVTMTADFKPRRTWGLIFPAMFNKSDDVTYEAGN